MVVPQEVQRPMDSEPHSLTLWRFTESSRLTQGLVPTDIYISNWLLSLLIEGEGDHICCTILAEICAIQLAHILIIEECDLDVGSLDPFVGERRPDRLPDQASGSCSREEGRRGSTYLERNNTPY